MEAGSATIENPFEGWLNATQAAQQLGIHFSLAGRWCRTGKLRAIRFGRYWVVDPASVEATVEIRRKAGKLKS